MAWEPVIYRARGGAAERWEGGFLRDWISVIPPVFTRSHQSLVKGEKPEAFCFWLFGLLGLSRDDELDDLFPGSGAVQRAWRTWRGLPPEQVLEQAALFGEAA